MPKSDAATDGGPTTPNRWNRFYEDQNTPWDLGCANPALIAAFQRAKSLGMPWVQGGAKTTVLLPGCGRGHDGVPLLDNGFCVTGVDFAPTAAEESRKNWMSYGLQASVIEADVTKLPKTLNQTFDLVVEHTCFVALPPALQPAYVESMAKLLKPGGFLVGIFFHHEMGSGPPYGLQVEALKALFEKHFEILYGAKAENSLPQREKMIEWAWILRLKA